MVSPYLHFVRPYILAVMTHLFTLNERSCFLSPALCIHLSTTVAEPRLIFSYMVSRQSACH